MVPITVSTNVTTVWDSFVRIICKQTNTFALIFYRFLGTVVNIACMTMESWLSIHIYIYILRSIFIILSAFSHSAKTHIISEKHATTYTTYVVTLFGQFFWPISQKHTLPHTNLRSQTVIQIVYLLGISAATIALKVFKLIKKNYLSNYYI